MFLIISCAYAIGSMAQNTIIISKQDFHIYVLSSNNDTVFSAPVGLGVNFGDKKRVGDKRTPEGVFTVKCIENSSNWAYDFHDGYGVRHGAYGPWFIRLNVPRFTGIGIHGTCFPESVGHVVVEDV